MSIKDSIVRYIRDGESVSQGLGLEIEHFVVNDADVQIEFHEVSSIIEKMAGILNAKIIYMDGYPVGYVTDDYSITLEPACQFEISINPYSDIETIRSIYEDFVTLWTPVLKARGYHLETKGNLPLVEQEHHTAFAHFAAASAVRIQPYAKLVSGQRIREMASRVADFAQTVHGRLADFRRHAFIA